MLVSVSAQIFKHNEGYGKMHLNTTYALLSKIPPNVQREVSKSLLGTPTKRIDECPNTDRPIDYNLEILQIIRCNLFFRDEDIFFPVGSLTWRRVAAPRVDQPVIICYYWCYIHSRPLRLT